MFMDQIFDVKINIMDNVDLDIINSIEEKCFKGESLSQNELDYYLNYVIYQTREILALNKQKELNDYSFDFMCDTAQSIIARYFDKLNIAYKPVETGKAITNDILGHSFLLADFTVDGEDKTYILDPTYNQFFGVDKCSENNFKIINGIVVQTPDLGYFALKEDENNQNVIKNLIRCGYMELTEDNAKIYGDLFYKTKTGNINYFNSKLGMSGDIYIKGFRNSDARLTYSADELLKMGLDLKTVYKENLKKKNK